MYNNPLLNIDPRAFKKRRGEMPPLPPNMGGEVPPLAPPVLEAPPESVSLLSGATRPRRVEGEGLPMPEMVQMPEGMPVSAIPPPQNLPQGNRTEQAILSTPPLPKGQARKGFGGRAKDVLEALMLSGGNPLVAGITAFNPDILTRFKDQQFNEPRWQQQRKQALSEAESLDEADRRDLLNEATQAQIANLGADNQRMAAKDAYDLEQKRKDALSKSEKEAFDRVQASLKQKADLTKEDGEYSNSLSQLMFGKNTNKGNIIPSLDNKGFFRQPSTQQVQERKLAQVTNEAKARNTEALKLKIAELPIERQKYADRQKIQDSFSGAGAKLDLTGVPTPAQFENAKSGAVTLSQRAQNAQNAAEKATGDEKPKLEAAASKLQAQADAALGEAWALHSHIVGSGGYEDNSGGGYPGIKRLQRTKKGGVVGGNKQSAAANSSGGTLSQADYDYIVQQKGEARAKAYLAAKGLTVK